MLIRKFYFRKELKEKLSKSEKSKDYSKKLLQSCKSWVGPFTKSEELQSVLLEKSDSQGKIVKTELTFYCNTHKIDMLGQILI